MHGLTIIPAIIGFIIGVQAPGWLIIVLAICTIAYMGSEHVRSQELGALIYWIAGICFILGMAVGHVYLWIFFPAYRPDIPLINPFVPWGSK